MSDAIADVMLDSGQAWMHAYTYSAHPVGCAVALAMLDIIEGEDFPAQAAHKGARLLGGLRQALGDHPNVGEVRGLGLMCGIEYVKDRATKEPFDAADAIGPRIHAEGVTRGLFSRTRGDVYQLAPPIVTGEETIDRCVEILAEATKAVLG